MAHIKTMIVYAITYKIFSQSYGYYFGYDYFKTFTDDHGNKTYFVNGKAVSKDEGNKIFLDLKQSHNEFIASKDYVKFKKNNGNIPTWKIDIEDEDVTYEQLIARCEKAIDPYIEYIDRGYFDARKQNEKLEAEIKYYKQLIAER